MTAAPVSIPRRRRAHAQRGSILIITIMLLLMVTVLAVGALSLNSSQTRMATNTADAQIAFQTAEGALNQVQSNLLAGNYPDASFYANTAGFYVFDPAVAPLATTVNFTTSAAVQGFPGSSGTAASFIIELLPSFVRPGQSMQQATRVYRITSRAVGPSGGSEVKLQATVQVQQ